MHIDINKIIKISEKSGLEIIKVYEKKGLAKKFIKKKDNSPLTAADIAAHEIIATELAREFPNLPLLSEENNHKISFQERSKWQRYWLVDPLDGTKEFLKKNGEFTINIALILNRKPILGVIHIPCSGRTYFAEKGKGSFLKTKNSIRVYRYSLHIKMPIKG